MQSTPRYALEAARILLVEDDQDQQELLYRHLEREGFAVQTACGGDEAFAKLQAGSCDLVLSDLNMPSGSGLKLVAKLRQHGMHDVAVILMSAEGTKVQRVSGLELGADDFLPKPFSLEELSARIGAHLRCYRRQKQLLRDSLHDALTQVLNRRGFEEVFRSHASLLRRRSGALSLLLIDIDDFKHINDIYGHTTGDRVLIEVARLLSSEVRASDRVARLGGDEFVVLMPEADAEKAQAAVERVRNLCPIHVEGPARGVSVRLSVGATTSLADEPLEHVTARADAAMYADKRSR